MIAPARFRKRPVEVTAVRWSGDTAEAHEIVEWIRAEGGDAHVADDLVLADGSTSGLAILVVTLEGTMAALPGRWIVKGTEGEFYPCHPGAFATTFEAASFDLSQPAEWEDIDSILQAGG